MAGEVAAEIRITVNGEGRLVSAGTTVAHLLADLGLVPERVAVERNLEVLPRSRYGDAVFADGDVLEIVHFVGGG